ncbi:MAG: hypothetical protein OQK82_06015 [Candidatus Pacearchaeota archaeon]|nr:hypothetical protein [Candidatus Pacearchaeota archaeon]
MDYLRWKNMKENQEVSERDVEIYTQRERLLSDWDVSANHGFVSPLSLEYFLKEVDCLVSKRGLVTEKMKKRLGEKASRNTVENLYALAESALRVSGVGKDFKKYEKKALKIAEDYLLDKEKIENRFKNLPRDYFEKLCNKAEDILDEELGKDFIGSVDKVYGCQMEALKITKGYSPEKEVFARFDAIKNKYNIKI